MYFVAFADIYSVLLLSYICVCYLLFQWQRTPAEILSQGQTIVELLSDASKLVQSEDKSLPDCKAAVDKLLSTLTSTYDEKMGGFGRAPKFPQPGWLMHSISLSSASQISVDCSTKNPDQIVKSLSLVWS